MMIRESTGVGVVLGNDETAFVVEQPVQDVRRFMGGRRDDVGVTNRSKLLQQPTNAASIE